MATTAAPTARNPLKVFRIDDVSISLFARDRKVKDEMVTFYSASFSRSFTDRDGKRKYSKSFDIQDLGKVAQLAKMVEDYVIQFENR